MIKQALKALAIYVIFVCAVLLLSLLISSALGCSRNIDVAKTCPESLIQSDPESWHDCCVKLVNDQRIAGVGWAEAYIVCIDLMNRYEASQSK